MDKHLILLVLIATSAVCIPLVNHQSVRAWLENKNRYLIPAFYILSRVCLFVGLYFVLRVDMGAGSMLGTSDLVKYYKPQGEDVLMGKVPGVDFTTAYSPLFPYLMALVYAPFPIEFYAAPVLLFILADLICLLLVRSFAGDILGKDKANAAAWTFMLCPLTWVVSVHYGQDEVLSGLAVILTIYLIHKSKPTLAGLFLGLGVMLTKLTTLIAAVVYVLRGKFRMREAAAVLTPMLLVAIVFGLVLNADLMGFARGETRQVGGNSIPGLVCQAMGMNIYEPFPKAVKWTMPMLAPRMPDLAEPELEEKAENVVTLALTAWTALAVFAGLAVARKRKLPVYETFAVVFLFFFVLSFKSICLYRAWIVCPLLVIAIKRRWYWLFGAWATVSSAVLTSYGVGASVYLHLAWNGANVVFELIWLILILTAAPIETPEKPRLVENAAGAAQ